jgi:hypothetical protein
MKRLKKILKVFLPITGVFVVICLTLFIFPQILFAYKTSHKTFTVYSDRPIDKNISAVLDDAISRLSKSEFYDVEEKYELYICNDIWRLMIFSRGNSEVGAFAFNDLTRDIFFRPVDIPNNKIIPPESWEFAKHPFTLNDRPLSYYVAHEVTHNLESEYTSRMSWQYPRWLIEGYADYVGKAGDFDFDENLKLFKEDAPELNPAKGLYRRYHLCVAYLLDIKKQNIKDVFANPPSEEQMLAELKNL